MADGRHLGKIEKSPYLGDGWTYRHEIWHADAVWPSWPFRFESRAPVALVDWLVYALDVSCSFFKTFAVQNDKIANLNLAIKQQILCFKNFNGDGSKTAKIIKGTINHTNIAWMSMFVLLLVPFMIFAVFDPSPLTMCINCCFFTYAVYLLFYYQI